MKAESTNNTNARVQNENTMSANMGKPSMNITK
jgi:hypothetical protein